MSDNEWLKEDQSQKKEPEPSIPRGRGRNRAEDKEKSAEKQVKPECKEESNDNEQSWVVQNTKEPKKQQATNSYKNRSTVEVEKNISAIDQVSGQQLIPDKKNDTSSWVVEQDLHKNKQPKKQEETDHNRGNRGNRGNRQEPQDNPRGNRRGTQQQVVENTESRGNRGNRGNRQQNTDSNNRNRFSNGGFDNGNRRNEEGGFQRSNRPYNNEQRGDNGRGRGRGRGGYNNEQRGDNGRGRGRGGYNNYNSDNRQNGEQRTNHGNYNNNRFGNNNGNFNNNPQVDPNAKKQSQAIATTVKLAPQPTKRICWPECTVHICHVTVKITLKKLDDIAAQVLLMPYKSPRLEYYPGNTVNQSKARYKDRIKEEQQKGQLQPGHITLKRAVDVASMVAIAFLRIQQGKLEQSLEKGIANFFSQHGPFLKKSKWTSVVFCTSKQLGDPNLILKHVFTQIQAHQKDQFFSQLIINTNSFQNFNGNMQAYKSQLNKLFQSNDLSIE